MDIERVLRVIEEHRKRSGMKPTAAAIRAGITPGAWRQFMRGGMNQGDVWVKRTPNRSRMLSMAAAVSALDEVAELIDATATELDAVRIVTTIKVNGDEMRLQHHPGLTPEQIRQRILGMDQ